MSCKKEISAPEERIEHSKNQNEFFQLSIIKDSTILGFAREIKKQDMHYNFLDFFIKNYGYMLWNEAKQSSGIDKKIAIIPFAFKGGKQINGFVVAKKNSQNVYSFQIYQKEFLSHYSLSTDPTQLTGVEAQTIINYHNYRIYGRSVYKPLDYQQSSKEKHGKSKHILSRSTLFGKASFPIKDTSYETSSTNCVSYWQETAWYYDPDGDADPCDCSGNETYEYSTYNVVTVCSQIGTSTDNWWAGQGVAVGSGGGGSPSYDPNYPFQYPDNLFDAPREPVIDNGIDVEDYEFPPGNYPSRKIAETEARRDSGTPEDLDFGYTGDNTGIRDDVQLISDDEQFVNMTQLIDKFTGLNSSLKNVGYLMIDRFRNRTGGSFRNPVLNNEVNVSSELFNFCKKFGEDLKQRLIAANGNINNIPAFRIRDYRPIFNGFYNKFHGLQILINDTEHTDIQLDDFYISSTGSWTAYVTITITDNFGVDKNDALTYQVYHKGFASWWMLQNMRGYVPFKTSITVRKVIKGNL